MNKNLIRHLFFNFPVKSGLIDLCWCTNVFHFSLHDKGDKNIEQKEKSNSY